MKYPKIYLSQNRISRQPKAAAKARDPLIYDLAATMIPIIARVEFAKRVEQSPVILFILAIRKISYFMYMVQSDNASSRKSRLPRTVIAPLTANPFFLKDIQVYLVASTRLPRRQ